VTPTSGTPADSPGGTPSEIEAHSAHRLPRRGAIHLVNFRWLTALRSVAIVGQTLAILFVRFWMEVPLPLLPLGLIIGVELLVNWLALQRGRTQDSLRESEVGLFVGLDSLAFTALLYFTGGPSNPFSFFYIVHVAVAALVLSPPYAWSLVGFSVMSYSALFMQSVPLTHGVDSREVYLHGIWVAYGLGATCIVYFLQRARAELQEREAQLAKEAELRRQAERLSSLVTLAAGAAHELASPLGTIAVVSKELENDLRESGQTAAIADLALMRTQVERCRKILARMAHTAGEVPGEAESWVSVDTLIAETVEDLPDRSRIQTKIEPQLGSALVRCPKEALSQALRVLLDNALEAAEAADVELRVTSEQSRLLMRVVDRGSGMDPGVLQRVFEPFFTTKAPGKGMGLGLYLARNVVLGMGGSLEIDSGPGQGTEARICLPRARFRLQADESPNAA
jgi:two-component system sensor histidine kinase RegB